MTFPFLGLILLHLHFCPSFGAHYRLAISTSPGESTPFTVTTSLVNGTSGSVEAEATHSVWPRKGGFISGTWLGENKYLIQETVDQGPLLLGLDGEAIPIAPALFEVEQTPDLYTRGVMVHDMDRYHLLLYGLGAETSPLLLYHSENNAVEHLPFWQVLNWSPDGQWLTLMGYRGQEIYQPGVWLKHVDAATISVHRLSESDSHYVAWSADASHVAVGASTNITTTSILEMTEHVYLLPPSHRAGELYWSPSSEFLAARGFKGDEEMLYLIQKEQNMPSARE